MATTSTLTVGLPSSGTPVASTSRLLQPSSLSTKDANVGKVTIRATQPIPLRDATGAVIGSDLPSFTFPYAPGSVSFENLADKYTELPRPGRAPLVRRDAKNPTKISLTATMTAETQRGTASCEEQIAALTALSQLNIPVVVVGMGAISASMQFRVTDLRASSVHLNPQQQVVIANVDITLTQDVPTTSATPGMVKIKDVDPGGLVPSAAHASGSAGGSGPSATDLGNWAAAKLAISQRTAAG